MNQSRTTLIVDDEDPLLWRLRVRVLERVRDIPWSSQSRLEFF